MRTKRGSGAAATSTLRSAAGTALSAAALTLFVVLALSAVGMFSMITSRWFWIAVTAIVLFMMLEGSA